jgi:hypothetical protein
MVPITPQWYGHEKAASDTISDTKINAPRIYELEPPQPCGERSARCTMMPREVTIMAVTLCCARWGAWRTCDEGMSWTSADRNVGLATELHHLALVIASTIHDSLY